MQGGLRVLVADDDPVSRLSLKAFLAKRGHEPILARDGCEAIQVFEEESPDLVVMDGSMPGMDGFEATSRIKELSKGRWVPVIFLSGSAGDEAQVRGLECGGDDYLIKPVNPVILEAKLRAVQRTLDMQNSLQEHAEVLAEYRDENEREHRLAKYLMQRLIRLDEVEGHNVYSRIIPATKFSGDVLAAARTPSGNRHFLLADGTGHGLGASLTVMPVVYSFYDLTHKGYGIRAVVRKLNEQVRHLLPRDRFIALTLVSIREVERIIQVWNGGNPSAVFVDAQGKMLKEWRSRHLALGILPDEAFDVTTEDYQWSEPGEFLIWSDGLVEARGPTDKMLDRDGALALLQGGPREGRFDRLLEGVRRHVGGQGFQDDVSVLQISCEMEIPADLVTQDAEDELAQSNHDYCLEGSLEVSLGVQALRSADPIPVIVGWLDQLGLSDQQRCEISLVVTELLVNAIDHGVLGLDSSLKAKPEGFVAFMAERQKRMEELEDGFVRVRLDSYEDSCGSNLDVSIADSGPGFDFKALEEAWGNALESDSQPSGRGIALVRTLCSKLIYSNSGSKVTASYPLHVSEHSENLEPQAP